MKVRRQTVIEEYKNDVVYFEIEHAYESKDDKCIIYVLDMITSNELK